MTHSEASRLACVATQCTQWTITFGGKCLNCGWNPALDAREFINREPFKFADEV